MTKKNKRDSKIIYIILMFIFLIIGIGIGLLIKTLLSKESQEDIVSIYDIEPIVKEYIVQNERNVYLYNTNAVNILKDNQTLSLKDYLLSYENLETAFQTLIPHLKEEKKLQDGGTIIYKTKEDSQVFDKDLTIIYCHTEDNNNDLYFGEYMDTSKAFQNGACGKSLFNDKKFYRIYTITKVEEVKDIPVEEGKYYLNITITDDKNNEVTISRIVSNESKQIIKPNRQYYFYFENQYGEYLYDRLSYLLENCNLIGIVPYENA